MIKCEYEWLVRVFLIVVIRFVFVDVVLGNLIENLLNIRDGVIVVMGDFVKRKGYIDEMKYNEC